MNKVSLAIIPMLSLFLPVRNVSSSSEIKLNFNQDGSFKIVVFSDCQDGVTISYRMVEFMKAGLDYEKPDLVVFLGDNVMESNKISFKAAASLLIKPVVDRKIPFAYTYGNHDDEYGVSKEDQYEIYNSTGYCVSYDQKPELTGFGTCNIPVYASNDSGIAFNVWMADSNSYLSSGYDCVHEDQIDFIKQRNAELEKQEGHKVNSILFQHIIVSDVYDLFVENPKGEVSFNGKKYDLKLNENASGQLNEIPCCSNKNYGELDSLKDENILGIFSGHDHANSFTGKTKGINLTSVPGMSFQSYGDESVRGYGVINLNENDLNSCEYHVVKYTDYIDGKITSSSDRKTTISISAQKVICKVTTIKDKLIAKVKKIFKI